MSILNVDKIQPIGGGSTITVDATDIQASTGTIRASTFSGDVSATGIGVTSLNVTGVSTFAGTVNTAAISASGNLTISNTEPSLFLTDTNGNPDYKIFNDQGALKIYDTTYSAIRLQIGPSNGLVTIAGNTTFTNGITLNPGTISAVNTIAQRLGDTDTKIRFPANDTFTVETAGSERLRIASAGLVTIKNFNGAGLQLQGSGGDYQGMQLQTTDSSASQTRNIFIDTLNELGNAVANQVGSVQSDGGSAWIWQTQPVGNRNDRRVERLRIDSNGYLSFAGDTDTYIHHPSANQLAITVSGGSTPIIRFGTGGSNGTVGIKTDSALVTNGEALAVRGYSSFKSLNDGYAAIYTHNEQQGNSTIASHILFNVSGANRGGFGYDTDNSTLIMGNQNAISFKTGATQLGGTERLIIPSDGGIELKTDGRGIKFPDTQTPTNAMSTRVGISSEMRYYESGTFVPGLSSTVLNSLQNAAFTDASYARRIGRYVRCGHLVHVNIEILMASSVTYAAGVSDSTAPPCIVGVTPFYYAYARRFAVSGEPDYNPCSIFYSSSNLTNDTLYAVLRREFPGQSYISITKPGTGGSNQYNSTNFGEVFPANAHIAVSYTYAIDSDNNDY